MTDLCRQLFPVGEGSHATPSEVSVTYFGYPDAIKRVDMTPKIAPNGPIYDADDYRRRFPGRTHRFRPVAGQRRSRREDRRRGGERRDRRVPRLRGVVDNSRIAR